MKFVSSYLLKHIRKHVWDHDSNPKDYVYLQLVDFVYVHLLVCMWVLCVCFCLLFSITESIWIMNKISFYLLFSLRCSCVCFSS